ncbi:hypothetical protein OIDMADRAFT_59557 [Oidiodendron maius Zn]|uniref:Rhodopsin domain-containing protein n=1 Tax=Oidiodendron maius (strain Zn) TaxID=913774 RepID=A0A0C3GWZ8_OIDMZ|nr:hypothetical protein OIDMADRAFT_59557 [Oidiodendron maius Zn]
MSFDGIPDSVLENFPAGAPPEGVTPNFINPPNHDVLIITLNTVLLTVMWTTVILRLYAKGRILRTLGWDDYTSTIAALGSTAHSVFELYGIHLGYGRHIWDIRATTLLEVSNVRLLSATSIVYPVVIYFVKLSILLLYLRIFGVYRFVRFSCYFAIVLFTLFYVAYLGVQAALLKDCINLASLEVGVCKDLYALTIFQSAFNVVSDIFVFLIPIPCILKLQVRTGRKIGLLIIFLAGFVACGVSIARLVTTAITLNSADKFWYASLNGSLTCVEINVAITAACMSTLLGVLAQVKRYGSSVYKSLRSRLYESRSGSATATSSQGIGKSGNNTAEAFNAPPSRKKTLEKTNYIPLEDGAYHSAVSTEYLSNSDNLPLWGRP